MGNVEYSKQQHSREIVFCKRRHCAGNRDSGTDAETGTSDEEKY
ncbi:MAG: hypothetical protein ACLRP8_02230 [Roseburia intestinalis]